MKKIIKLTEQQLSTVVNNIIDEEDVNLQDYPVFVHHWEEKFEKSVGILLGMGRHTEDLIKKIQIIYEKNKKQIKI
jgi:hypothetical protein